MKKATYAMLLFLLIAGVFLAESWYTQPGAVTPATSGAVEILHHLGPLHSAHTFATPAGGRAGSEVALSGTLLGTVDVSPEQQQLIGVRVSKVEKVFATQTLRLFGRVAPDETQIYKLNSGVDGFIREVSPVTTGSLVKKDQWLATFSAPESRSPIQAYLVTLGVLDRSKQGGAETPAQIGAAETSSELAIDRLLNVGMSRLQIEEIRRTRQVPTSIRILAPADGFVLARNVSVGQKFERGTEWYRIAALDRVWILADVFEDEAQYLRPGMMARVSLPRQKTVFSSRISEVLPQFDAATRTLKVRLEADNPGFALRPDMFVDVEMTIQLPPAITVPVDAVLDSGLRKLVFVDRGNGHFEPRPVETGWGFGEKVEIVKGLTAGERIVVSGTFLLDSESRMRSAPAGATGHMHAAHAHQAENPNGLAPAPRSAIQTHGRPMHPPAAEMTSAMTPVAQASANAEDPARSAEMSPQTGDGHGSHDQAGHDHAAHDHGGHEHP